MASPGLEEGQVVVLHLYIGFFLSMWSMAEILGA